MPLARILAVIDGGAGSEAALKAALGLGKRFAAQVELLHVEIDAEKSVPIVGEGISGATVQQIIESLRAEARSRLETASGLFDTHCVKAKLSVTETDAMPQAGKFSVSFNHLIGREAEEVLNRGRLADLIVLARSAPTGEGGLSTTFDAALFDSGRPVLLLPANGEIDFGATVAIAWDRSRESARAVSLALPFLAKAKKVVILTAREADTDAEPSELVHYLAAHGVQARTWAFTPHTGAIGDALLSEAQQAGADLLVMGGYGHSRLRELILGGATRGVLAKASLPVLMAH